MDDLNMIKKELDKKSNKNSFKKYQTLLYENKPLIIIIVIIFLLLIVFKPKMVRDDITNKVDFILFIKWWVLLILLCYGSNYIFNTFSTKE